MKQHISPKELSRAIGASESSLKRWADDGLFQSIRTAGGHRRIQVDEAVRFIRQTGLKVIEPDALGLPPIDLESAVMVDGQPQHLVLGEALCQGDGPRVRGIILGAFLAGHPVAAIFDHWLTPAMAHIGELWRHDAKGIFIEHRATALCIEAINQLRSIFPRPDQHAPAVVGAAISGDIYTIPSLMAATVLADGGWRETNLGADTPIDAILLAAEASGAKLVWLSISIDLPGQNLARELTTLAEQLHRRETRLIVGGRGVPIAAMARWGHVHIARSMSELASYAAGLRAVSAF